MRTLPVVWQRLVSAQGETCERCGATEQAMRRAMARISGALRPLGFEPVLETRTLDERAFRAAPAESNRIWIAGRPLEEWLGATVGASPCCSVCGTSECRTVEVEGRTYEAIPEELILRAALAAARAAGASAAAP